MLVLVCGLFLGQYSSQKVSQFLAVCVGFLCTMHACILPVTCRCVFLQQCENTLYYPCIVGRNCHICIPPDFKACSQTQSEI